MVREEIYQAVVNAICEVFDFPPYEGQGEADGQVK